MLQLHRTRSKKWALTFFTVPMSVGLTATFCWFLWSGGKLTPGLALGITMLCLGGGRLFAIIMVKLIESMYGPFDT
jgi:hypothetical protein